MTHVTAQMIADAINSLEADVFDTHAVEQRVLRDQPVAVARDVIALEGRDDPLQQFSAAFSQRIGGGAFAGQIERLELVTSPNLGGRESQNRQWRARARPVHPRAAGDPV